MNLAKVLARRAACVHEQPLGAAGGSVETCFDHEALEAAGWLAEHVLSSPALADDIAHNLYDLARDKRTTPVPWYMLSRSKQQRWLDLAYTAMTTIVHSPELTHQLTKDD